MLADPGLDRRRLAVALEPGPRGGPDLAAQRPQPAGRRRRADQERRQGHHEAEHEHRPHAEAQGASTVRAMSRAASFGSTSPVALLRYQARISAIAAASSTIDSATPSATATRPRRRFGATRIATAASATTTNGSRVGALSRMRTLRCAFCSCSDSTSVNVDATSGMLLARSRPRSTRRSRTRDTTTPRSIVTAPSSTDTARGSRRSGPPPPRCAPGGWRRPTVGELVRPAGTARRGRGRTTRPDRPAARQPRDHLRRPQLGRGG